MSVVNQVKLLSVMTWDLLFPPEPQSILTGERRLWPFRKHQNRWFDYFHESGAIGSDRPVWSYLHQYVYPLILRSGSHFHLSGLEKLSLNQSFAPDFEVFCEDFKAQSGGWEVVEASIEIPPRQYFEMIKAKRFPCVRNLRSHDEIFCAAAPDFWHEAIGHLAPLCFAEVQDFYTKTADWVLSSRDSSEFAARMSVAWTLMEYGFLLEDQQPKMFGAALVGSHLAHMRWNQGLIALESADLSSIEKSGFYTPGTGAPRTASGQLRFFVMNSLSQPLMTL